MKLTAAKRRQVMFAVTKLAQESYLHRDTCVTHYENCNARRDCVHAAIRSALGGVNVRIRIIQRDSNGNRQVNEAELLIPTDAFQSQTSVLGHVAQSFTSLCVQAGVTE